MVLAYMLVFLAIVVNVTIMKLTVLGKERSAKLVFFLLILFLFLPKTENQSVIFIL